jgi:hypothetical protein
LTSEQTRNQERIFAYDFSASITPGMRRWMTETMSQISAPNRNDPICVFVGQRLKFPTGASCLTAERQSLPVEPEKNQS